MSLQDIEFRGDQRVYDILAKLTIPFQYIEHPPVPTVEEAEKYWVDVDAAHCKNLFFRNHKGDKHYLVIFHYKKQLNIRDLEQRLKQGKLSFASAERMHRFLGLTPGSVSPFGLIHDAGNHVHLFIDSRLQKFNRISFHPNLNTASLVISFDDFVRYLNYIGNTFEFIDLYDD
jgi:Ala-tRNA(Pro) deacylase